MHTSAPADQHNSATVRHRAHALCCVRRVVSSSRSYAGPHGMTAGNRSGSAAAGFGGVVGSRGVRRVLHLCISFGERVAVCPSSPEDTSGPATPGSRPDVRPEGRARVGRDCDSHGSERAGTQTGAGATGGTRTDGDATDTRTEAVRESLDWRGHALRDPAGHLRPAAGRTARR